MERKIRTQDEIINDIIHYFNINENMFVDLIEELDSYNGYLGDDRYYCMCDLDEIYCSKEPTEILTRAFYGYDEMFIDKDGNHAESFNPNRDYFRYNGYGNLVSTDVKDYSCNLDTYFVRNCLENRHWLPEIDSDLELSALFDELEEAV